MLPGSEATHRWKGRILVDLDGDPLGSIEVIYLDKVTSQPEWALLDAGAVARQDLCSPGQRQRGR
jgi:hypothetical protein